MRDIWGFLLQTLTVSGGASVLLCVKWMLGDKLTPRWQFGVWSVLLPVLLLPAGKWGRYVLVNWPVAVETIKTLLTGEYTVTRVAAPVPLPAWRMPGTVAEWVFALYCAGAALLLLRYLVSYLRLRLVLRGSAPARAAYREQAEGVAEQYGLPVCRMVEVAGLPSAFVCGVFLPVLALPAVASLYFHFQLFTDLAAVAAKYQDEGEELDKRLLRWRTIGVVALTASRLLLFLPKGDVQNAGALAFGAVMLVVMIGTAGCLFALRRLFREEQPETPTSA